MKSIPCKITFDPSWCPFETLPQQCTDPLMPPPIGSGTAPPTHLFTTATPKPLAEPVQHHKTNQAICTVVSLLAFFASFLCVLATYKAYKISGRNTTTILTSQVIPLPGCLATTQALSPPYNWNNITFAHPNLTETTMP
jgi:hypothetical protein